MRARIEPARRVIGFWLADLFLGHLPRKVSYVVMTVLGWIVATVLPGRIRGLRENLKHVFPDYSDAQITDLMQRNAKNYGKFWVDLFKIPRLEPTYRRSLATIEGISHLREVLDRGRGCIAVSVHMGAWEGCISVWADMQDIDSALIAEVLEPPYIWRRVLKLRETTGMGIIPLRRSAPRDIMRRLNAGGVVAAAIDRDITGTGEPYEFFGEVAAIGTGMFEIAQRTGAGIVPVLCLRQPDDNYRVVGFPPLWVGEGKAGVDTAVQQSLRLFEDCIRQYPDQWHVMEALWPARFPAAEKASAGAPARNPERQTEVLPEARFG